MGIILIFPIDYLDHFAWSTCKVIFIVLCTILNKNFLYFQKSKLTLSTVKVHSREIDEFAFVNSILKGSSYLSRMLWCYISELFHFTEGRGHFMGATLISKLCINFAAWTVFILLTSSRLSPVLFGCVIGV